ncbi:PREDICTED: taste receptor type 2 member 60-like [Chrysochloris asiatica]|uniref:Taste receptor type 2 member 60-like n=1 Tax=Chrysochloris asiatica TaxID=185453 RepID=A0A9B0TBA4_CHRAS|nr:PREDICTED: taste receptor type 2 member 60-like [Chrysochloris asiatica]
MDRRTTILAGFLFLLCLVAVAGNGAITAALGIEWLVRKKLSPHDTLLVSLGDSRFCLQWVVIWKNVYLFLYPEAYPYNPMMQFISFQWDFLNAVTLWFSTWLSVFYCVKIATFTHPAFLWLKQKVSRWVPWMLLSSLGLSSLCTILFFIGNQHLYQNYLWRDLHTQNVTGNGLRRFYEKFFFFPLKVVIWTVPTALFVLGMVLLITSLGRHAKKALLLVSGFRDTSAQAHIKALLALVSFAILFISNFLSLILNSAGVFPTQELQYWMWQVVIYLCMAVHPIIQFLSNPKLRAALQTRCCPMSWGLFQDDLIQFNGFEHHVTVDDSAGEAAGLSALVVSAVVTLLFFWGNHMVYQRFLIGHFEGNKTYQEWNHRLEMYYFLPLKLATLFLASRTQLINFPPEHRMRSALHSLISILVLYALPFMSLIIDAADFSSESD